MSNETPRSKLTIGLAGCGSAGVNHAQQIVRSPEWTLAAVCDVRAEAVETAGRGLGDIRTYTDYSAMLAAEQLDAVAIITPAHVHVPQIVQAAADGPRSLMHVLSEGSWATDDPAAFAEQLMGRAAVMTGFMRGGQAFDPEARVFPSLANVGVFQVITVLGQMVQRNPNDQSALTALVRFFNFNLRISTPCSPGDCQS